MSGSLGLRMGETAGALCCHQPGLSSPPLLPAALAAVGLPQSQDASEVHDSRLLPPLESLSQLELLADPSVVVPDHELPR